MIRRILLSLAALAVASVAHGQTIPCPQQPVPAFVRLTDTTYVATRAITLKSDGSCLGVVTYVRNLTSLLRYEVQYIPCMSGDPWRVGAQFTTLSVATRAAAIAPSCGGGPPPVVVIPPVTPPPVPIVNDTSFRFCTTTGALCQFVGLRDVRLVNANNTYYITKEFFGDAPCAQYGFTATVAWSPPSTVNQQAASCSIGAIKTLAMSNPFPGMAGSPATWVVMKGDSGISGPSSGSTTFVGSSTPGEGSVRMTCNVTKYGTFDPLVFPNLDNRGHLHVFFGNAGIVATSTSSTLVNSGNSTCVGGTLNRTAYWSPAVFNQATGGVIPIVFGQFYYKTGYNANPTLTQPFPAGLHMIAGDKNAIGSQDVGPNYAVQLLCRDGTAPNSTDGTFPNCRAGDELQIWVAFPQCWDGVNLDSPTHVTHMRYFNYQNPPAMSSCPATHPVQLPAVTEIFKYAVTTANEPLTWRLSCDMDLTKRGGLCAHADWMMAWNAATMAAFTTNCLNAQKDCQVGFLGNGTELLYVKP